MNIYKLQSQRRSTRKFKDKKIDYKLLEKFVYHARLSPSSRNSQPIRYMIATDEFMVDAIFPYTTWAGYLKGAHSPTYEQRPRAYILFLYDEKISTNPRWDMGASSHAIQLMAVYEGISSCCLGAINRDKILKICNVPTNYSLDTILALGYQDESPIQVDAINGDIKYYQDENKQLHVPKRSLDEVLIR